MGGPRGYCHQRPATGRTSSALTSVQKRTARHHNRKWLRARANISRSTAHAYFLLPRPPPSSRRRKRTCAGCWPGGACTESRWDSSGQSFQTTWRRSSACAGRLGDPGNRWLPRWTRHRTWSASELTPGPNSGCASAGVRAAEALLAGPAPRAVVAVQPGGRLSVRDWVERRLAGPRCAPPRTGHELEEAGRAAC